MKTSKLQARRSVLSLLLCTRFRADVTVAGMTVVREVQSGSGTSGDHL